MPKQLTIDEMLQIATDCDLPSIEEHLEAIEEAATSLAKDLAKHLHISAGQASFEGLDFAGTCVPFMPKFQGQPVPEELENYDEGGDWEL